MIAYCPYCGSQLGVFSVYRNKNWIIHYTWDRCKRNPCLGNFENIVTTQDLFVTTPYYLQGRYIGRYPDEHARAMALSTANEQRRNNVAIRSNNKDRGGIRNRKSNAANLQRSSRSSKRTQR